MTLHGNPDHSRHHRWLTGIWAAALSVALLVIAYGILEPFENFVSSSSVVSTTARPGVTTNSVQPDERIDAPRECAPDKGITEACVFE